MCFTLLGSAYYFAALVNNYTVNFVDGAFPIQSFFDDLRDGVVRPSVIALAGSGMRGEPNRRTRLPVGSRLNFMRVDIFFVGREGVAVA